MAKPEHPEVEAAHRKLEAALDEACDPDTDVMEADTAELIRMEESLAAASEAAKEAISVRKRLAKGQLAQDDSARENHRYFDDDTGKHWHAFAVHPVAGMGSRALPEPYRNGWLSFDSGTETRRIAPIPPNWQAMPENELRQLCERADIALRRTRSPNAPVERPDSVPPR
jgi:hypothetical protein